jgi:hypothetical protein
MLFCSAAALAAEPESQKQGLVDLGRLFAEKIGRRFKEADLMMMGHNSFELAQLRANSSVPEGETLIFQATTGKKDIILPNDVLALVQNNQLMISLTEFFKAVDFAIQVIPEGGTAAGWFIREDQLFALDTKRGQVDISGRVLTYAQNDVYTDGADIYVSSLALEKWFSLQIQINLASLQLAINGVQPLPIEERELRSRRAPYQTAAAAESKLPLVEKPYQVVNTQKPNLDVTLSSSLEKNGQDASLSRSLGWSVIGSGDLLGMSSQSFIAGDYSSATQRVELVRFLRQSFSRDFASDSWVAQNTGVSRASIGDINPVSLPIIAGGVTGQGVRLTNQSADNITTQTNVDIRGNAQPGWDVEIYRNDNLVGTQTVGPDGEYLFQSVFLFAGNNQFKIILYGPQGEIREETRDYFSSAKIAGAAAGNWDVALTRSNIITYRAQDVDSLIDGDLNLTAKYERNIGNLLAARVVAASIPVTDETVALRKNFVGMGLSSDLFGATVSSDAVFDAGSGAFSNDLTVRRNFGRHLTGATLRYASEDFSASLPGDVAASQTAQAFVSGPLAGEFMGLKRLTYAGNLSYLSIDGGTTTTRIGASVNSRLQNIFLGAGLQHSLTEQNTGQTTTATDASVTARGSYGDGRWRATSSYDLKESKISSFDGDYTYKFSDEMEGVVNLRHTVLENLTELELSGNWNTSKFTLSPRLSMNNRDEYRLSTNLRFGLAENPYSGEYEMFRRNITDSGGFAGRVFLDKNGDGVLNGDEELLQDVDIRAVQSNKRAATDEKGQAFIPDVPRGRRTDVVVDAQTFPDAYYMTLEDGISIRPRPGVSQTLDYPIIVAGEMDGTATVQRFGDTELPARNLKVRLTTPDGRIEKEADSAFDGYFDVSSIRPGVYYLHTVPAPGTPAGYIVPRLIAFNPDGSSLFGNNLKLRPEYRIPFFFTAGNMPETRKTRVPRLSDIEDSRARVKMGPFHSRVSMMVSWYKFKFRSGLDDFFTLAVPLSDIAPNPKAELWVTLQPKNKMPIASAAKACELMQDIKLSCGVEVITAYKKIAPAQENPDKSAQAENAPGVFGG